MGAQAILVVTSTSTGFVNEWSSESFEYLLHGDSAIVAMQYSTLPSALGLLTARDEPPKVGRLLFKAVAAKIASMPQDQRPKLYAGGESLGAYGGNGAFDSPDDMLAQVDGALWTGTPSFTPNHESPHRPAGVRLHRGQPDDRQRGPLPVRQQRRRS